MELWISDEGVFECIGQAVDQSLLSLRMEIIGRVDRGLIYGMRNLMPIRAKRSYTNCCWVSPILDTYRSTVSKTKFIPLYSMSIHLELLFFDV